MLGFVGAKIAARAGLRQTSVSIAARAASTVGAVLEEAVENLPHKYAVRFIKQDYRWSFKEFNDFVDELANGFLDSGFEKGSVIAVWLPNSAENVSYLMLK
jgi:acyl-CoA synthetase (AMP-forming)/AMP-acid ligase II